jgi:hypothetical protein
MITECETLAEVPNRTRCQTLTRAQAEEWPGRVWHYRGTDIRGRVWEIYYGELAQADRAGAKP